MFALEIGIDGVGFEAASLGQHPEKVPSPLLQHDERRARASAGSCSPDDLHCRGSPALAQGFFVAGRARSVFLAGETRRCDLAQPHR